MNLQQLGAAARDAVGKGPCQRCLLSTLNGPVAAVQPGGSEDRLDGF